MNDGNESGNNLIKVPFPVVVEGKYDKIRLSGVIDAPIISTGGFSIFHDKKFCGYLREICDSLGGLIVFTDSDGAGLLIRSHIRTVLGSDRSVYNLYSPRIQGKEKRKDSPSKEGFLGVEGIDSDILRRIFVDFLDGIGSCENECRPKSKKLTKSELFADGLSGRTDSRAMREGLCEKLGIPENISAGALIEAINLLDAYEMYSKYIKMIKNEDKSER